MTDDHSRVVLEPLANEPNSDYVNASFMDVSDHSTVEPLTTTPLSNDLPATTTHFILTDVFPYIVVISVATTSL